MRDRFHYRNTFDINRRLSKSLDNINVKIDTEIAPKHQEREGVKAWRKSVQEKTLRMERNKNKNGSILPNN